MKKKKIILAGSVLMLSLVVSINANVLLKTNKHSDISLLTVENVAQAEDAVDPMQGPMQSARVHCYIYKNQASSTAASSLKNNKVDYSWGLNGTVGVAIPGTPLNASVGGGYETNSSIYNSDMHTKLTENGYTILEDYWATKRLCERREGACKSFDPCLKG